LRINQEAIVSRMLMIACQAVQIAVHTVHVKNVDPQDQEALKTPF